MKKNNRTNQVKIKSKFQCIYTFIAGPRQRVKLNFDQFQLASTAER